MNSTQSATRGAHHIGLTVPDIGAAARFFIEALGFKQVGEVPDYPAIFVSDDQIMITLWQVQEPESATPFDRKRNIGLHHLALAVNDLDGLAEQLAARDDIEFEFRPEPLGSSGLRHLMCGIPGNIRLELIET